MKASRAQQFAHTMKSVHAKCMQKGFRIDKNQSKHFLSSTSTLFKVYYLRLFEILAFESK